MKRLLKFLIRSKTLGVLTLVLMLPLSPNIAEAVKPGVDCGLDPPHPSCKDDGDSGDGTMTFPGPVTAWWTGAVDDGPPYAATVVPRECTGSGNTGNGGVSYECRHRQGIEPEVNVFLSVNEVGSHSGSDPGLCRFLSNPGLVLGGFNPEPMGESRITTSYAFLMDPTWNDTACVAGAECLVRVDIWAYFDDWCTSNGKKCGRLVIVQGWVNDVEPADDGDLNPFTDDQLGLPVSDLTVTFKGIGTNRDMATCFYQSPANTFFNSDSGVDP